MTEHQLKTLAQFYDAVERGDKTFEVRKNDRGFQTGDTLVLQRYEESPTGVRPTVPLRSLRKKVLYLLQGGQYGVEAAYCILALGDAVDA